MARVAKYIVLEKDETTSNIQRQMANEKSAMIRLLNKSSSLKIFETICDPAFDRKNISLIHIANNLKSWEKILDVMKDEHNPNIWAKSFLTKQQLGNYKLILRHIFSVSDNFITSIDSVSAIKMVAVLYNEAIKSVESWEPKRNNPKLQLFTLVKHLFAKYETPDFLINGFTDSTLEAAQLYLHIGSGKTIKTYPFLPNLILNKKTYQYLFEAPADSNYYEGFRYAQVFSMGGNERLFKALMDSELRHANNDDEFWVTLIDLFVKAPMFDYSKINQIIDYIRFRRNNTVDFSMKHRTIGTLLNQTEKWHEEQIWVRRIQAQQQRQLARQRGHVVGHRWKPSKPVFLTWNRLPVNDFHWERNKHESYDIKQLLNSTDLWKEGEEMRHCVGSYASSCASGTKSIFSLRKTEDGQTRSVVTMEVVDFKIVQAKGKGNSAVSAEYKNIIKKWADREAISFSKFM